MAMGTRKQECACAACVAACQRMPGWLSPNDVRRLAQHRGVTPQHLFETELMWDFWVSGEEWTEGNIYVPIPCTTDTMRPGTIVSWGWAFKTPHVCAFLTAEERCSVHAAKPSECAWSRSCNSGQGSDRRYIARAWNRPAARRFSAQLPREEE